MQLRRIALVYFVIAAPACNTASTSSSTNAAVIERWLTCEECVDHELDSVVAHGATVRAPLRAALDGPPLASVLRIRASGADAFVRARAQWSRLSTADRALRPLGDSAALVDRNAENFRALYSLRAARALLIVDPDAKAAIRATLNRDSLATTRFLRADVRHTFDSLSH